MRDSHFLSLLAGGVMCLTGASEAAAQVARGPYPDTTISRNGELIWYTGGFSVVGRRLGEMDAICRTVPIPQVSGWRAPTMAELRTLTWVRNRENALTRWQELVPYHQYLVPIIPLLIPNSRNNFTITILSRDIHNYDGVPTTLENLTRGSMPIYKVNFYQRGSQDFLHERSQLTENPRNFPLPHRSVLLCVAER